MPKKRAFMEHDRGDLEEAIRDHGGFVAVAQRLQLQYQPAPARHSEVQKPAGYWQSFENVMNETLDFVRSQSIDRMPTYAELKVENCHSLMLAITRHGGILAVAQKLGLSHAGNKPAGFWDDFDNLERELRTFISNSEDRSNTMPMLVTLTKRGGKIWSMQLDDMVENEKSQNGSTLKWIMLDS